MLELLGKLNARIAELNDGSFIVGDQETPRVEALAAAAGAELAGVKEIRYNRSGDSCFWGVACADGCATPNGAASSMPDLHPEPIDVECSVDVDWWLKPSA